MSDSSFGKEITRDPASQANRRKALKVLRAALEAVDPANAVRRYLRREGSLLRIADQAYNLDDFRRVLVVGGGKASGAMANAVEGILGDRVSVGWINVKDGYTAATTRIHLHEAGHPLPDSRGVAPFSRAAAVVVLVAARDMAPSNAC